MFRQSSTVLNIDTVIDIIMFIVIVKVTIIVLLIMQSLIYIGFASSLRLFPQQRWVLKKTCVLCLPPCWSSGRHRLSWCSLTYQRRSERQVGSCCTPPPPLSAGSRRFHNITRCTGHLSFWPPLRTVGFVYGYIYGRWCWLDTAIHLLEYEHAHKEGF